MKRIGVLAVQGDVSEHVDAVSRAGEARGEEAEAVPVRRPATLEGLGALILPGGESTTISKILHRNGLFEPVRKRVEEGSLALLGTCAGMIVMAKRATDLDRETLGLMDIEVVRNAFGRQVNSFETGLDMEGIDGPPLKAVFIRAPLIRAAGKGVKVLARLPDGGIVAARQGHLLATAFHPELTDDDRVHAYFLSFTNGAKHD